MKWLRDSHACREGFNWFKENFPDGGDRDEVLKKLEEVNELDYYWWLLWQTLRQRPLPKGWVIPSGMFRLDLGGGTLPEGTVLPEGLETLYLDGGVLPEDIILPWSLDTLVIGSGIIHPGTVLPQGLRWLISDTAIPQGLAIPENCIVDCGNGYYDGFLRHDHREDVSTLPANTVTYGDEKVVGIRKVLVNADFDGDSYGDGVPFAVGSNQTVVEDLDELPDPIGPEVEVEDSELW
jgi:hypothetical protein